MNITHFSVPSTDYQSLKLVYEELRLRGEGLWLIGDGVSANCTVGPIVH